MTYNYPVPQPEKSQWTNARLLAVDVEIDAGAAQALLPPPLLVSDPPRATVFCADYPEGIFGIVYREAAVLIHCTDDNGPAVHCAWIMVDDDTALIQGRELLGFPKKMADFTWEEKGDTVVGTVTRKGVELMRIEGRIGADAPSPAPVFGRRFVNAMGSVVAGMQLVDFAPAETYRSAKRADVSVELASSIWDPGIGELDPRVVGEGVFAVMDFGGSAEPPRVAPLEDVGWAVAHFLPRST